VALEKLPWRSNCSRREWWSGGDSRDATGVGSSVAAELSLGACGAVDGHLTDVGKAEVPELLFSLVTAALGASDNGQRLTSFDVGRICQRSRTKLERVGDDHDELPDALRAVPPQHRSGQAPSRPFERPQR
jgi:hypothetical protein